MKRTEKAWTSMALMLLWLCLASSAQAAKTDVVVLINGDNVTGEIKSLEFGELRYSTDSMGTVSVEWEEIVSLRSDQSLQVEVASGTRYFGNLFATAVDGVVGVGRGENVQELNLANIVRITPIETDDKIWQRLEGSVKFGFDSDKASEVTSGHLNANVRYRARTYLLGLDITSSITDQPGAETTQNQSLDINYQRFRASRWFTDWFAGVDSNDAQGLDRRLSAGGGLGRYFVQNNNNQLSLLVGLVATRESLQQFNTEFPNLCERFPEICTDQGTIDPDICTDPVLIDANFCADAESTNAEGKFSFKYLHRRHEPSSEIVFTTDIFPLLEDFSSFRSNSNLTLRREIVEDLFFDLSVYYKYLSDPAFLAEKEDYGVVTSIGYSF
jgi:hypothetical protein